MISGKPGHHEYGYIITGVSHFVFLLIAVLHFKYCSPQFFDNFKTKYGSIVGLLLPINISIQFLMAITLIANQFAPNFSMNLVFEALGLFQQLSFHLMILFIGGVYNKDKFDKYIKPIAFMVCLISILFKFV